jgi:hypothetical protein
MARNSAAVERVESFEGARPDYVVVPEVASGTVGAIVYWSLHGRSAYAALVAAWAASSLPEGDLPGPTPPAVALAVAVQTVGAKRIVRPYRGGWVIGREQPKPTATPATDEAPTAEPKPATRRGEEWSADEACYVWLMPVPGSDRYEVAWEGDEAIGLLVRAQYEAALVDWIQREVSRWLPGYLQSRCRTLSVRDSGGIYYVPPASMAEFREIRRVVHAASGHRIESIPVMRGSEAVEAILHALTEDTQKAMEEALEQGQESERKAKSRLVVLEALRSRLAEYEQILDANLGEVSAKLDDADRALTLRSLGDAAPATE